ncbi:unnamed protein product [Lathyrus oleraceus]
MESLIKKFLKFLVLFFAITSALAINIQALQPCCEPLEPCDPQRCKKAPCCIPPSSNRMP